VECWAIHDDVSKKENLMKIGANLIPDSPSRSFSVPNPDQGNPSMIMELVTVKLSIPI
jgi:hypothetical protein